MGELSIGGMLGGGNDVDFAAGEPCAGAPGKRGPERGAAPPVPSIVRIVPGPFGDWQPIVKIKLVPATKCSQRFLAIEALLKRSGDLCGRTIATRKCAVKADQWDVE